MPAQSELPASDRPAYRIPGVYERLLAGACRCGFACRSDPRLFLQVETEQDRALWNWVEAECAWEAEQDRAERLAAGEPYVVSRLCFGGHSIPREDGWPAWLRDPYSEVRTVRVFSDDTIEPANMSGDRDR